MTTSLAPRDHTVTFDGLALHYCEWGAMDARPLVLLHGITGHARTWDHLATALQPGFRVIALDQRGHGDSHWAPGGDYSVGAMAADVKRLADHLGLGRVLLLGLSMGGRVAIAFAGTHPERVERLVIVDIGPDIAPEGMERVRSMVGGVESDILSPEIAKRMLASLGDGRLVEIAGAGHSVPGDQPEAFAAAVRSFLV